MPYYKEIVNRRTEKGIFKTDPEFPTDVDERSYPILTADTYAQNNVDSESFRGRGEIDLDADMAQTVFGEGGLLSAGIALLLVLGFLLLLLLRLAVMAAAAATTKVACGSSGNIISTSSSSSSSTRSSDWH